MREAELKHARLAMLAAAGWPLAELWSPFKGAMTNGRAPSLFNGHLFDPNNIVFTLLVFGGLAYVEVDTMGKQANLKFDPLGLYDKIPQEDLKLGPVELKKSKEDLALSEIKHGRAAMMAITGFAVQEFVWGTPVVKLTPMFF